jgi:hypothetical protein
MITKKDFDKSITRRKGIRSSNPTDEYSEE